MEVAEITGAALLLIEIAEGDVQSHGAIAHRGRVELARCNLETRIEIHSPFDNVSFASRLRLSDRLLCTRKDPFVVRVPGRFAPSRLAFKQSAHADAGFARLRQLADHSPR